MLVLVPTLLPMRHAHVCARACAVLHVQCAKNNEKQHVRATQHVEEQPLEGDHVGQARRHSSSGRPRETPSTSLFSFFSHFGDRVVLELVGIA